MLPSLPEKTFGQLWKTGKANEETRSQQSCKVTRLAPRTEITDDVLEEQIANVLATKDLAQTSLKEESHVEIL